MPGLRPLNMKIASFRLVIPVVLFPLITHATGLPEPGILTYGVVRNAASGNARLVTGTLVWTISPAIGNSVTITTVLTNIGNQYSYLLRVPFESVVGNGTPTPNVLQ